MARRRFDSLISRRMESGRRPTGESQWRFFRTRQTRIRRSRAHRSVWCAVLLCGALGVVFLSAGVAGAQTATWSISPSPDEGSRTILNDASCTSSTSCVAVGEFITSTNSPDRNLVESWNGTSWSIVPSPNQGSGFNQLNGVSCTSAADCVAVGSYNNSSSVEQTLVETWNGTSWSIISSPNEGSNPGLDRVSCTSSTDCVAVGSYNNSSSVEQTLVETWNGASWSIISSPNEGSRQNALNGVSCTSSANCVAVGFYVNSSSIEQTLVETWNGTSWSTVSSPDQGSGGTGLSGVSCTSSTNCVAVGFYTNTIFVEPPSPPINVIQTLVEAWNGTSWSVVSSPNEGTNELNQLGGVSCTSSTNCVAVGFSNSATSQTLVETWNGASWSVTPSPSLLGNYDALADVSCSSSTNCVAVGYDETSSNPVTQNTLIETTGPTTSILVPSTGATLSGSTYLDAGATNATSVEFLLFGGSYGYNAPVVCTATLTYYGWLCSWNTTTVPNGSYALVSYASGAGASAFSSPISITVDNVPLATQLLLPKNGSQISGTVTFDASAQGTNITGVYFVVSVGSASDVDFLTATPTYYGWIGQWNSLACPPGYANTSYSFQSVVTQAGGATAMSAPIDVTLNNTTGGCP